MNNYKDFDERLKPLNRKEIRKQRFVLYWMQQSQRAEFNHALEFAVSQANDLKLPLLVIFGLSPNYPEANIRHYNFMLQGLAETQQYLERRGIKMIVRKGHPPEVVLEQSHLAAMIICDRGYLKHQKLWREQVASKAPCLLLQVESDVIIPVGWATRKAEYAARTIRPKIKKNLDRFLEPVSQISLKVDSLAIQIDQIDVSSIETVVSDLDINKEVSVVTSLFRGGTMQAKKRFEKFIDKNLEHYDKHSNQPQTDDISHMSLYLHFGQISPLYLALEVMKSDAPKDAKDAFMEQLAVRRELAINFVEYTPGYDQFDCVPEWARKTLREHRNDPRTYNYTVSQMECAQTHDEYWNASMLEMKYTGFMHNYMRMYWGKKILEWSKTPEDAFKTVLYLNNKYFIDGRDPNSYTSVAWLFGLHDRPFKERNIFGKVRYMAASGLERKCDIKAYVKKVKNRIAGWDNYFISCP
ncbi:MAG: deoxyribodipyrimidine photo-lyase [Desulfobacterales bacterium]